MPTGCLNRCREECARCASTIGTKVESTPFSSLFDNTARNIARREHGATGVPDRDSGRSLRWWIPYRNFGPTSLNSVRPSTSGHALPSVLSTLPVRPSDTSPTTAARALTYYLSLTWHQLNPRAAYTTQLQYREVAVDTSPNALHNTEQTTDGSLAAQI